MKCVLRTPERDIQPRESSIWISAYVVRSRPRPPYSSGIVDSEEAELLHRLHELFGVRIGVLELHRHRHHVTLDELANGGNDLALLDGQVDGHRRFILSW